MADEALAVLADRYKGGAINNTRVAIRKVRGTRCGYEISFDLEVVTLGEIYDREPITTCVVKWQTDGTSAVAVAASKERWPTSSEVFRQALRTSVTDDGICAWPFGNEGSKVRAVPLQAARTAFFVIYLADGDDEAKRTEAASKVFKRAVEARLGRSLIVPVALNGVNHLWLIEVPG